MAGPSLLLLCSGRRRRRRGHRSGGDSDDNETSGVEESERSLLSGRFVEHEEADHDDEEEEEMELEPGTADGGGSGGVEARQHKKVGGVKLRKAIRRMWKGFKRTFGRPGALNTGVDWFRGMEWLGALPTSFMMAGPAAGPAFGHTR